MMLDLLESIKAIATPQRVLLLSTTFQSSIKMFESFLFSHIAIGYIITKLRTCVLLCCDLLECNKCYIGDSVVVRRRNERKNEMKVGRARERLIKKQIFSSIYLIWKRNDLFLFDFFFIFDHLPLSVDLDFFFVCHTAYIYVAQPISEHWTICRWVEKTFFVRRVVFASRDCDPHSICCG